MGPLVPTLLVLALLGGCAWRANGTEHYLGPSLFRHGDGEDGRAIVSQVRTLTGLQAEGGRQWGLALGVTDRIAAAPSAGGGSVATEWSALGLGRLDPHRWHFSPFYLRGERVPAPGLVVRRLYGAQIAAGEEVRALSVGIVSRAHVVPFEDAVWLLQFHSTDPLATRFVLWRPVDGALPFPRILEEIDR